MKVRMRITLLGTRNGVRWPPAGGLVELPEHEAQKLCAAGFAEPAPDVERAVPPAPEKRARARKPRASGG